MAAATNTTTPVLSQTGVLGGRNPFVYSATDPIALFIVQAFIIIALSRLLHWPLSYMKQPRVIAEVITGILLGDSVMGHVPHFTNVIFPTASIPNLTTVANLGLIMFLFIVGMEVDLAYVRRNLYTALSVGALGMILPFSLGWAVAVGIYQHESDKTESFGIYGLFVSVALSITALPVLARILTELRLLRDRVGTIVLSAGIANDLVGWILLALTLTLATNAHKGINTLYTVLIIAGWFLIQFFIVRRLLWQLLNREGSFEKGPSQFDIAVILLLVMVSSFLTDVIGVHPIFGAFIIGVIVPRDNDFVVKLTAKIEDFISVILIPLYFALAGLSCNIGLLNDGTIWGYVFALIFIAFVGKVVGGTLGAKMNGLYWQESLAVGVLMSCKGIVEIVVLTTGLNAKIISTKVFSMFIVMTLVTTFLTSPLTLLIYTPAYRQKIALLRASQAQLTDSVSQSPSEVKDSTGSKLPRVHKLTTLLSDVKAIPASMTLIQLLSVVEREVRVHGINLIELSQRTHDLIQATSDTQVGAEDDPLLSVVHSFSQMNDVAFSGTVSYVSSGEQASYLTSSMKSMNELLMVTWNQSRAHEPLGALPASDAGPSSPGPSTSQRALFLKELFTLATSHVALFVDRGVSASTEVPRPSVTEGGPSFNRVRRVHVIFRNMTIDILALGLALQLAENPNVSVVVDVVMKYYSSRAAVEDDDVTIGSSEAWDYVGHIVEGLSSSVRTRVNLVQSAAPKDVLSSINLSFVHPSPRDLVLLGTSCQLDESGRFLDPLAHSLIDDAGIQASVLVCQHHP